MQRSRGLRRRIHAGIALMLCSFVSMASLARAETGPQTDLIVLLDRSGSMAKNDPQGLAIAAVRLLADVMRPDDRLSVIAFDATAREIFSLQPVSNGDALRQALAGMGRPVGAWTDVSAALKVALRQLSDRTESGRKAAVLLVTDGNPETGPGGVPPGYEAEMMALVGLLSGRGAALYPIGLGDVEGALLQRMADLGRGISTTTTLPEGVASGLVTALGQIKDQQLLVAIDEPTGSGPVREILVPPYAKALTLCGFVTGGGVRVDAQSPTGISLKSLPGVRVSSGPHYIIYTVPSPAAGRWTVQTEGAGHLQLYAQVESALSIRVTEPQPFSQVPLNQAVPVRVTVAGDPDPGAGLELYAQSGTGKTPVRLSLAAGGFTGDVAIEEGTVAVWAVRAGAEILRREFRLYPTKLPEAASGVGPVLKRAGRAAGGILGVGLLLLAAGELNWRRTRRHMEVLQGRLGDTPLVGRQMTLSGGGARVSVCLVPSIWAPVAGLGFGSRTLIVTADAVGGSRLQINGRPPGDGRLYHGDVMSVEGKEFRFFCPHQPRRSLREVGQRAARIHTRR